MDDDPVGIHDAGSFDSSGRTTRKALDAALAEALGLAGRLLQPQQRFIAPERRGLPSVADL